MKHRKRLSALILALCIILGMTTTAAAQSDGIASVDVSILTGGESIIQMRLVNDDSHPHTYQFSAEALPIGIQVMFKADGLITAKTKVNEKSSFPVVLNITSEQTTPEGTYRFNVSVKRDDGMEQTIPLSVTIDRSYRLSITSATTGLKVINGDSIKFEVAVANTGGKEIADVALNLELPKKWIVKDIAPQTAALKPGQSRSYKIEVIVPPTQVAGTQTIKITAATGDVRSDPVELPVRIQNNINILPWLIALLAAAAIGTIFFIRKHGRR